MIMSKRRIAAFLVPMALTFAACGSSADDTSTAPIDISALIARDAAQSPQDDDEARAEADRASQAALRRWRAE